jgi:integrase
LNLGVKIAGTPPASRSIKDEGDSAYERSRAAAQAKLNAHLAEIRSKQNAERLVEQLYEIKTGEQIKSITLAAMADEWERIPRKRKPNARYASQCKSTLAKFAAFIRAQNPNVVEMAQITRPMARAFMEAETARGVTAKTWNDTLKLLRATCKYLLPAGAINPFSAMPTQEAETVFRKPYSPEELKSITDAAASDDFIRPIIVAGMCTAMRRGDCCLLKWKDVDLKNRFITVKTSKTGATVSIPIFPMLYEELSARSSKAKEYVFPEQAAMYRENPDGITWRVKKVLAVALGEAKADQPATATLPEISHSEARQRGLDYIDKLDNEEKKARMSTVFSLYMDGKSTRDILAAAGVSKGSMSGYLNEIETAVGCRIIQGRAPGGSLATLLKNDTSLLRAKREGGTRSASVHDFHSFRVTWVTVALTGGVPLELVQKVTGHKTTEIVLKHYFQPGREAFRKALSTAMPALLTNGQKSPRDEIRSLAQAANTRNSRQSLARILELVEKL